MRIIGRHIAILLGPFTAIDDGLLESQMLDGAIAFAFQPENYLQFFLEKCLQNLDDLRISNSDILK